MTEPAVTEPSRSRRWRRRLMVVAAVAAPVAVLAHLLLQPNEDMVFSVTARTGVLQTAPLCNEELVWDLPPGRVMGRSADSDALAPEDVLPLTVTLHGGALARLVHRPTREIAVTFDAGEPDACPTEPERRVQVRHGEQVLAADAVGYEYLSMPLKEEGSDDHAVVALPLIGRVILGEDLPYGAGWSGATPLLQSGEFRARRGRGAADREQSTYLEEQLDAGVVVDTLPRADYASRSGYASAAGFAQVTGTLLNAQLYTRREIGIRAYAGAPTTLSVSRWRVLIRSPLAQILFAIGALALGFFGLAFSAMEAMPNHRWCRFLKRALRDEPENRQQQGEAQ